jgi:hypothetical protein
MIDRVVFCFFAGIVVLLFGYALAMVAGCGGVTDETQVDPMYAPGTTLQAPTFSPPSATRFRGSGTVTVECQSDAVMAYATLYLGHPAAADVVVDATTPSVFAKCVDPRAVANDSPMVRASYEFR